INQTHKDDTMNSQKKFTGYLLIFAAVKFWISWFLMPDPGTTDSKHILQIVKQSRNAVFTSIISQIISSVEYITVFFLLVQVQYAKTKKLTGIIIFGIGALGLCSDAFFHLLAYFMTDSAVSINNDVIRVMEFMQTKGVLFLIPILLPFFIGTLTVAIN